MPTSGKQSSAGSPASPYARSTIVAPGHAAEPRWAAALAVVLAEFTPEALAIMLEGTAFSWHETLGIPPVADASAIRRAMTKLALIYHPDTGGSQEQMIRINAAYETACASSEDG